MPTLPLDLPPCPVPLPLDRSRHSSRQVSKFKCSLWHLIGRARSLPIINMLIKCLMTAEQELLTASPPHPIDTPPPPFVTPVECCAIKFSAYLTDIPCHILRLGCKSWLSFYCWHLRPLYELCFHPRLALEMYLRDIRELANKICNAFGQRSNGRRG